MSRAPGRHPRHDLVAAEVSGWYTTSAPGMGYDVEEATNGVFTTPSSLIGPRAILRADDATALAAGLAEVRERYRTAAAAVEVWIEGRSAADRHHAALVNAGCELQARTVYLALTEPRRASPPPPEGLEIEVVTPSTVPEWVAVQAQGFASNEDPPAPATVARDVELRRVELDDVGRLWLARLDGEAVAGLAFYDGDDRLVNSLACRVPFRGRGIAQALLAAFIDDTTARGCRSALINADADDWPVQLYRRMGFTDEVLFHARYTWRP